MSDDESTDNEQVDAEQTDAADDVAEAIEETEETEPEPPPKTTFTVTIDGRPFEAEPGKLVIDAAIAAGSYVPHFCYHPRMTPVGMCRQCFVEVEGPRGPMMVVSCMTPVAEGQVVNTATDGVKRAQEGMLELFLVNHPLDCPVCDKGGECPLQDQAFSHGPGESRYVEQKRHYEKPIPLSDLVLLDRERCILCDRCTRFADEVAGDKLIHFVSRGNNMQVLTFPGEPFASYFSGNTVQICPVGALTATPYRFKARPWDLDQLESTCTTCSVGCRTVVQSSRDELVRYQGVDSEPVNWGWLCDRGRFGYEATNSPKRLRTPLVRGKTGPTDTSTEPSLVETSLIETSLVETTLVATTWSGALAVAAQLVRDALAAGGPPSIGIVGGARGTNEDAYAWAALADALGVTKRDAQLGDGLPPEVLGLDRATIADAANAPTVVLLAPDLKEELPVLYLRLRDAAEKRRTRVIELSTHTSGLSGYAWKSVRYEPGHADAAVRATFDDAEVTAQLAAGDVVVVAGRGNLAESETTAVATLSSVLTALGSAGASPKVLPALRRGNVVGALQLGLRPANGAPSASVLRDAADGKLELLVLLGADPIADCPDADLARRALAGARRIIAVDTFLTESSKLADVVLAAAAAGEKSGTTTNLEGRVTPVAAKVTTAGTARPDWMIAAELALVLGHDLGFMSVDDVTDAIAASVPAYAGVTRAALDDARDGLVALAERAALPDAPAPERERNRYDYRLVVSRTLYDRAVGTAMSPSLAPLASIATARVNPLDLHQVGVAEGTEVRLIGVRGTVVLPLVGDTRVPRGIVWSPFNHPRQDVVSDVAGGTIADIVDITAPVTDVRIERL